MIFHDLQYPINPRVSAIQDGPAFLPHLCHVGGLEHEFSDFLYIGNFISPTDELILFRGVGQPPTRCEIYGKRQWQNRRSWLQVDLESEGFSCTLARIVVAPDGLGTGTKWCPRSIAK